MLPWRWRLKSDQRAGFRYSARMDPHSITAAARRGGFSLATPSGGGGAMMARGDTGLPNPELTEDDKIFGVDKKTAMIGGAAVLAVTALLLIRK